MVKCVRRRWVSEKDHALPLLLMAAQERSGAYFSQVNLFYICYKIGSKKKEGKKQNFLLLQSYAQQTVLPSGNIYKINGDLVVREGIFRIINCCCCPSYLQ